LSPWEAIKRSLARLTLWLEYYIYFITDMNNAKIRICMGSSCYARGNAQNAAIVQAWLSAHGLSTEVEFIGTLCERRCKDGPILWIGERVFAGVTPDSVEEILGELLGGGEDGSAPADLHGDGRLPGLLQMRP